jgi:hypothetical protein
VTTGIPYKVFAPDPEGRLRCVDRSACLGYGATELNYLRSIYKLEPGSIILLDTAWFILLPDGTWVEPHQEGDPRFSYDGRQWDISLANDLLRLADDSARFAAWATHNRNAHKKKLLEERP